MFRAGALTFGIAICHEALRPRSEYRRRYLAEMRGQEEAIGALADRAAAGETITLLCSSACVDPDRCHRTLLRDLIEKRLAPSARRVSPLRL